jgi:hypothetical protein
MARPGAAGGQHPVDGTAGAGKADAKVSLKVSLR